MNSLTALARGGEGPAREAAASGVLTLVCLSAVASSMHYATVLPTRFVPTVIAAFGLVLALVLVLLPRHHPPRRFGAANSVTLVRTAMASLLLGCVGAGEQTELAWWVVGIATLAASLDALDGALARRQGTASAFGARFDMEADAGLVLILSLLAWQFDKAGPWVLAAGFMRYAFVLAGLWLPWLRAGLPASVRRQTVCVVQVVTLIACLVPIVPVPWSAVLAALGLAALAASFLIDIAWLAREARQAR
jgi:phosphatidylglycerophosphate synthase